MSEKRPPGDKRRPVPKQVKRGRRAVVRAKLNKALAEAKGEGEKPEPEAEPEETWPRHFVNQYQQRMVQMHPDAEPVPEPLRLRRPWLPRRRAFRKPHEPEQCHGVGYDPLKR